MTKSCDIEVRFRNLTGGAFVQLLWLLPGAQAETVIPASAFVEP